MTPRYALDVDSFREAVKVLAEISHQNLRRVKDKPEYLLVKETMERFKGSKFSQRILYGIIMSEYDGRKITPGTVGSFLWGCYEDSCSPTCLGSIPDPDSGGCDSNIHLYREDKGLTLLNKGSKNRHIVLVAKDSIDAKLDRELSKIGGEVEVYNIRGEALQRQPTHGRQFWLGLVVLLALGFLFWSLKKRLRR